MRNLFIFSGLLLFTLPVALCQKKKSILFIGNSHIFYSDMPIHFSRLCASLGDSVFVQQRAPGGWSLLEHLESDNSFMAINNRVWDYIVLQEARGKIQANWFNRDDQKVIEVTRAMVDSIKSIHPCARIIWDMIHPNSEDHLIKTNSLFLSDSLRIEIAPVWKAFFDLNNNRWRDLLLDGNHQNVRGAYLTACVFYASIFHKSPRSSNAYVPDGMSRNEAGQFQSQAWNIVSNHFADWNIDSIDVVADFDYNQVGTGLQFENVSLNSTDYLWTFGDGDSSTLASPAHIYPHLGTYEVCLTARSHCKWDVERENVQIQTTHHEQISVSESAHVWIDQISKSLYLQNLKGYHFRMYDLNGSLINKSSGSIHQNLENLDLTSIQNNVLLLVLTNKSNRITFKVLIY